jgi:dTDP-4-amino-4,6-dideoxygalactose transaminase
MCPKPIYVTEPFLPPLEEYVEYLEGIWNGKLLTNQGPLVRELEQKIQAYHGINMAVHCVANGGLGLQIILKALGVRGEVITTPFSYVATASCPIWEGCGIKFADIEPDCLTIDPAAVESAIGPDTEAILATHVFGNPCDCEALEAIASKHGLALIFDAAHAFGVRYKDKSILEYGDASMVSLHATKLLHAVEGGFAVAREPSIAVKIEWMRRFGHKGPEEFHGVGVNAKLSELHAAMGLCNLNHLGSILEKRKQVCAVYDQMIDSDMTLSTLNYREGATKNYSYYPVFFDSESSLADAVKRMNKLNILPRRYFHPSLEEVFADDVACCGNAYQFSRRTLCLPLSTSLGKEELDMVISALLNDC